MPDIKSIMKILKKKKADFPPSLIEEIADASERHGLDDAELNELIDRIKKI